MTTGKYRTRSEYIEAVQLTADNVKEVTLWCGGYEVQELDPREETRNKVGVNIPTMEGTARVSEGDYVVRDANRRFWKFSEMEFQAKYVKF